MTYDGVVWDRSSDPTTLTVGGKSLHFFPIVLTLPRPMSKVYLIV